MNACSDVVIITLSMVAFFFVCHVGYPHSSSFYLTLVLLNPDIPCFANSVDPDQLASEEAN